MMREAISTTNAPAAVGPYSQAIVVGDLVFCAGQGAIDPVTQEVRQGTVEEETERTLKNLGAVLDAAGASFADVVKTTVFLADIDDFAASKHAHVPEPILAVIPEHLAHLISLRRQSRLVTRGRVGVHHALLD